eukprot:m.74208 g.74208  ORF g.74208 m.74208 type:complete len:191 (-) comp14416_c0_seq1:62-634(-)
MCPGRSLFLLTKPSQATTNMAFAFTRIVQASRVQAGTRLLPHIRSASTSPSRKWVGLIDDQDFNEKNTKLNRPMSPHLTIYKPQLTSMLSISHRATGIAHTTLITGAGLWFLSGQSMDSMITLIESFNPSATTVILGKMALAFPLTYHSFNGFRHLMWDTARKLELKDVYSTGYFVVGLSTVAALGLAML